MADIQISDLESTLTKMLTDYSDAVCEVVDKCARKSMKELVTATKEDAPYNKNSSGKHYKDLISIRKYDLVGYRAVYTCYLRAPRYRLAHLLNNGHIIKRGGKIVGKYNGDKHITKHAETIIAKYEKSVEEAVKNA